MAQFKDPVEASRLINLIPVGLKEAALDSPTSRATIQHYSEQVDLLEKWLEDYLKATNRLVTEHLALENVVNNLITCAILPTTVSETLLDHDFSVLAMRKYAECAKDYWMSMVSVVKRMSALVCEPIRQFQTTELKLFKETRKHVEVNQKAYDTAHAKYMGYGRFKEPSSLREEAHQLHETRKVYLKSCMEMFQTTPQFRFKLDKLLIRISSDQWKEMDAARDAMSSTFLRNAPSMQRVKGWIREMESSESSFQRELNSARRQLEEDAELMARPSRELDEYSTSTVPSITTHTHTTSSTSVTLNKSPTKAVFKNGERAGWLFLRTYASKPTRLLWVKRWAFVRNGVFGWLVHDQRNGGVEESERIGVLLCAVRPASQEERRFCFELKTNKNTIMLQAETQADLAAWTTAFEAAKTKAVSDPQSSDSVVAAASAPNDPAFSISAPPVPEFGTTILNLTEPFNEEKDNPSMTSLSSTKDTLDIGRRATGIDEISRESASRIMSKLEISKRAPVSPSVTGPSVPSGPAGGIASLIAASHGSMPVGPSIPIMLREPPGTPKSTFKLAIRDMPPSSLAPATLANMPTPTGLSKAAVAASGERSIRGSVTGKYGIPNGILANTWGSSNSSFVNRFDRSELRVVSDGRPTLQPSPMIGPVATPTNGSPARFFNNNFDSSFGGGDLAIPPLSLRARSTSPTKRHRNTISVEKFTRSDRDLGLPDYPPNYPLQLKTQDAQFRLLFPNVRKDERLTMVFRATWNPSGQQDFPGRAYVTTKELYFYSNHFGLVLTSGISLTAVDEVTAAPGKDCDFLFVHFKQTPLSSGPTRVTIKIFLEPLKLTQRRLNYLITNCQSDKPDQLAKIIDTLLALETEKLKRSPSLESWEEVDTDPVNDSLAARGRSSTTTSEFKAATRIDKGLYAAVADPRAAVFKLPAYPVKYTPPGYVRPVVEREYDVSAKALFHVMFGDRSALWQVLQHEHSASNLRQGPWKPFQNGSDDSSRLYRNFEYTVGKLDTFGNSTDIEVKDSQTIDVVNDHLCYAVTDRRIPWYLPLDDSFRMTSKIVITHVAKTKCKLSIYTRIDWIIEPRFDVLRRSLDTRALHDLSLDAHDVADLVSDQVRRLGSFSRTRKAVQIFGQVGQSTETMKTELDPEVKQMELRRTTKQLTIAELLVQDSTSWTLFTLNRAYDHITTFISWLNKTLSANSIILAFLMLSLMYNSWFSIRDGYQWYRDRQITSFLSRLGISPNTVMTKAVTIADLDHAMSSTTHLSNSKSSACMTVFREEYLVDDVNAPLSSPADQVVQSVKRLQSTRQRLGGYRHDLLVAMRVVNRIEQELVQSEWENWVVSENRRCRSIEGVISNNETTIDTNLSNWYQEYCGSCTAAMAELDNKLI